MLAEASLKIYSKNLFQKVKTWLTTLMLKTKEKPNQPNRNETNDHAVDILFMDKRKRFPIVFMKSKWREEIVVNLFNKLLV